MPVLIILVALYISSTCIYVAVSTEVEARSLLQVKKFRLLGR